MFSDILPTGSSAPKLNPGQEYTLTIETDSTWQPTESSVLEIAKQNLSGAVISKVSRGFLSNRFVITFKPLQILGLNTTINTLLVGMQMAGKPAKLVQIESGEKSTAPGGVKQIATETVQSITQGASDVAVSAVKPLVPWLIAGVIGLVAFTWWKVGGLDAALKPKQPNGVGKRNYESETT